MSGQFDLLAIPPGSTVELFISPSCPYCREAMRYYDSVGVPYTVHDAQNRKAARERMFSYSGGDPTVPVIVVDGRFVQSGWGKPPRG